MTHICTIRIHTSDNKKSKYQIIVDSICTQSTVYVDNLFELFSEDFNKMIQEIKTNVEAYQNAKKYKKKINTYFPAPK